MSAITAKASRKMKKYAVLTREPRCFLGSFDFSWEQRKAKELCNIGTGKSNTQDQVEDGIYPFYIRSDIPVKSNKYLYDCEAVITIGDGNIGRVFHYVNGKFDLHQRCYKMTDFQDIWGKYFYYFFSTRFYDRAMKMTAKATVDSVRLEMISEMDIWKPTAIDEQKKIAEFFANLDNLITLHQRKCVFLFGLFQASISMIFTASTFSWEQRKAVDIADYSKGNGYSKSDLTENGTPIILYGRLYTKYQFAIDEVDTFATPKDGSIYSQGNEVIIPASGETAEDIARASAVEKSGILLGGDLNILRPFNFINPLFLALTISNGEPQKELAKKAQGKSVVHIHNSDIQEVTVSFPTRAEQDRIVAVFRSLDNLITLHQRECISFTVRAGGLILTANKKRTTSSWEQRKLGDIADIVGGGTPSTGNQSYWDGDIDWYAPAEIADQIYANSSQKKITGLGYENSSAKMLPPGTVLFTSRAGIGKTAILTRKGCTNQGFQSIVPHRGELDSYFIFSRTEELKRYGELVGAGSTFVEVSGKQMAVMELMMPPTMREQQTIGGFFQQLDNLITLHQRKPFLMKWRTSDANRNQTNRLVL